MKTILISGGAGYLGTFMTQEFLKSYKVLVYDKFYFPWILKNKKKIKNHKNLNFINKDISEVNIKDFENIDIVCDLNGISNDDIDNLEISLKNLGKIVTEEKRKRRIADFKLSQQRLSSVASKYNSNIGNAGSSGDKPPRAPQSKPYTNFQPMMEINLDEDIDNNDSNDLNSLRRRHRGSVTDKKKKRRERATMGVSPYMRDSSNSGPLYKDS